MFYEVDRLFDRALAKMAFAAKSAKKRDAKVEIAQSEQGDLDAIQAAINSGQPTYWIRSTDGCTIDVLTNEAKALNSWRVTAERTGLGYRYVQLFKRIGTAFYPYEVPRAA